MTDIKYPVTFVQIVTKLSNGIEVSSIKGGQLSKWDGSIQYFDETCVFYDVIADKWGERHSYNEVTGAFDEHDAIVKTLCHAWETRVLKREQTTTTTHDPNEWSQYYA